MQTLQQKLDMLQQEIEVMSVKQRFKLSREWGGADVIIACKKNDRTRNFLEGQKVVVSFQKTEPQRRVVITQYAKELSWLFLRLGDVFQGHLDFMSKYDFYGLLAQSAIDYIEDNGDENCKALLCAVLNQGRKFC